MRCAFIKGHQRQFSVRSMCSMLTVHPSGYYAWLRRPFSNRALEDNRQTELLKDAWEASGKVYGYRKLHDDLQDQGESCCPNCVARLAKMAGIKAQIGYKRRLGLYGGKPSIAIDNPLNRQFDVIAPDTAWVTDITYIKTNEGFAYLAVVIDLFSRRVVGPPGLVRLKIIHWMILFGQARTAYQGSVQSRQTTDLVLQALLMAVWPRKPKSKVLIHSDQGSQFTSIDWASFLKQHNLEHSMSRRGNCHDNAVATRFFNLLKRERVRRKTYKTREDARQDIFDYIEMFYNPQRTHVRNGMLSPMAFETQQKMNQQGV
jgi:putative transposase